MLQVFKVLFLQNLAEIPVEVNCINGRSTCPSRYPIPSFCTLYSRCSKLKRNIVFPSQIAGQDTKFFHCKAIEHVINSLNMFNYFCSMSR